MHVCTYIYTCVYMWYFCIYIYECMMYINTTSWLSFHVFSPSLPALFHNKKTRNWFFPPQKTDRWGCPSLVPVQAVGPQMTLTQSRKPQEPQAWQRSRQPKASPFDVTGRWGKSCVRVGWWRMMRKPSRWWQLKHFFIFTPTWGYDPFWLICFRWVGSTTNQPFMTYPPKRREQNKNDVEVQGNLHKMMVLLLGVDCFGHDWMKDGRMQYIKSVYCLLKMTWDCMHCMCWLCSLCWLCTEISFHKLWMVLNDPKCLLFVFSSSRSKIDVFTSEGHQPFTKLHSHVSCAQFASHMERPFKELAAARVMQRCVHPFSQLQLLPWEDWTHRGKGGLWF